MLVFWYPKVMLLAQRFRVVRRREILSLSQAERRKEFKHLYRDSSEKYRMMTLSYRTHRYMPKKLKVLKIQ